MQLARAQLPALPAPLAGNPLALLSRLGKRDGDGLLAALHAPSLAAFSASQRAAFSPAHGARHVPAGARAVSASLRSGRWHVVPPLWNVLPRERGASDVPRSFLS